MSLLHLTENRVRNVRVFHMIIHFQIPTGLLTGPTFSLLELLKSASMRLQPLIKLTAAPQRNYIIIPRGAHSFIIITFLAQHFFHPRE